MITKVRIEASSHCQLKCPSCPTASGAIRKGINAQHLRFSDFVKLIEDNPSIEDVELSNYGEIFLNPALYRIVRFSFGKVRLHADNGTNFNYVPSYIMEAMVQFKFNSLTISIDGATKESYSRYRLGGHFDAVIDNIVRLNKYKQEYESEFPKLTWQFIVFGHNEHELEQAKTMAKVLDMKFFAKLSWDEKISPVKNPELVQIQTKFPYTSRQEYEQTTHENYCRGICQQLWNAPVINSDGDMLGCCRNFWGDFGPNVFKVGLENSLNSEKMQYAKNMLQGIVPAREDIPCTTCDIYHSLVREKNFLTLDEISKENMMLAEKVK